MAEIAGLMNKVAENIDNKEVIKNVKREAVEISLRFPLYKGML